MNIKPKTKSISGYISTDVKDGLSQKSKEAKQSLKIA
jgi:hypothetical protein